MAEPAGKARPVVTQSHGTYTPKKTRDYELLIQAAFHRAVRKPYAPENVLCADVSICAVFALPKSWSEKKKRAHAGGVVTKKPDADNIAKLICDALNGVAYKDDACVNRLTVHKRYAQLDEPPHMEAEVRVMLIA